MGSEVEGGAPPEGGGGPGRAPSPEEAGRIQLGQPGSLIRYGPLATMVSVGDAGGQKVVALRAETQVGMLVLLLDAKHAASLAHELEVAAAEAASGLTIVKS